MLLSSVISFVFGRLVRYAGKARASLDAGTKRWLQGIVISTVERRADGMLMKSSSPESFSSTVESVKNDANANTIMCEVLYQSFNMDLLMFCSVPGLVIGHLLAHQSCYLCRSCT